MNANRFDKALHDLFTVETELRAIADRLERGKSREAAHLEFAVERLGSALGALGTISRPQKVTGLEEFVGLTDTENLEP